MATTLERRRMRPNMRFQYLLAIQVLFAFSSGVLSLEDSSERNNNNNNSRIQRKQVDGTSDTKNENDNNADIGRRYLEALWETVEKNNDRKLAPGRMSYLESMMQTTMSMPSDEPNIKPTPASPTIPGPTLPTREPIPTKAPVLPPSQNQPIEVPTIPNVPTSPGTFPPTFRCNEAQKEVSLLGALSTVTDRSILLDPKTPQGMAYSFLLEERPSFVCSPTILQRYSLSTLYFSTNGAFWTDNSGWLGPRHECDWFGVECIGVSFATNLNLGAYDNTCGAAV